VACTEGCNAPTDNANHAADSKAHAGQLGQGKRSALPIAWQTPIRVATGGARRGPWRMNQSKFFYVDDASASIGDDGWVGVTWVDNRQKDVQFQAYDASGKAQLAKAVNVSQSPEIFSWLPRVL